MKQIILLLSTILIFCASSIAYAGGNALTTDEIKKLFSGKTSDWEKKKNGWKMKIYTAPNGEQTVHYITGKKAGEKRILKWSAEDNTHCAFRDGKKRCGKIVSIGNGKYQKINSKGKVSNTITNFVNGKKL